MLCRFVCNETMLKASAECGKHHLLAQMVRAADDRDRRKLNSG